ncbi:hypothetical protein [Leifsonia sp. NPDC058248]|uniref:hypothetical protein n=1 Tax=Leifsonia sp. NPDC058248 TaxID=3346402 RepID=UPI0036DB3396
MSDRFTRPSSTAPRRFAAAAAALAVAVGVVVSTVGAIPTASVEARDAARVAAVVRVDVSHRASLAGARTATADARRTQAVAAARAELVRARTVLASSAGTAAETGRQALVAAIASVSSLAADGNAFPVTAAVVHLKEAEKAVTDSVAAWKAAEKRHLAVAAAAAAAARAAAEYQASYVAGGSGGTAGSRGSDGSGGSPISVTRTAPVVAAPHTAPGVSSARPDNSGCGPCPGATLVLTPSGYLGCP